LPVYTTVNMFGKLRTQVLLILTAYLLISAILIFISSSFYRKRESINASIQEIGKVQVLLYRDIQLMNSFYLYESRNPAFFTNRNSKYLSEHHELNSRIRSSIGSLKGNRGIRKNSENIHLLNTIEKDLKDFSDTFYQIVLLISNRGFQQFGLEGDIKKTAGALKSYPALHNEALRLAGYQETFLGSATLENYRLLLAETDTLEMLVGDRYSGQALTSLAFTLELYKRKLTELKQLDDKIGVRFDTGLKKRTADLSAGIIENIQLLVSQAELQRDKTFREMQAGLALLFIVSGVTLLFVTYQVASRITYRVSAVTQSIAAFVQSGFSASHAFDFKESSDEVGVLIKNLRIMHAQLAELVKNFTIRVEEQTHELLQQKLEIEHKNLEIQSQVNELSLKSTLIEEHLESLKRKNKYIIDSINYARRIQEAMLPSGQLIYSRFPESFVLYMPKDIVSGDFYWMKALTHKGKEYTLLAVADCTGHGVPGAFMSMLGIAFLNEIVLRKSIIEPHDILNNLRNYLVNCLNSGLNELDIDDGMDIAVCLIDHLQQQISFAGAKRPMYLIKNHEVVSVKGTNRSICKTGSVNHSFTKHTIEFSQEDTLYLFTDGLTDQFGGPDDQKFQYKRLRETLLKVSDKKMVDQKLAILQTIQAWKGTRRQIDDITLIGLKLTLAADGSNESLAADFITLNTSIN